MSAWIGIYTLSVDAMEQEKTTVSYTVLPEILKVEEFVNADEIARGLSPFNPDSMAIEAGRLMLKRIDELRLKGKSFAI